MIYIHNALSGYVIENHIQNSSQIFYNVLSTINKFTLEFFLRTFSKFLLFSLVGHNHNPNSNSNQLLAITLYSYVGWSLGCDQQPTREKSKNFGNVNARSWSNSNSNSKPV
jgi:hypothetical protein